MRIAVFNTKPYDRDFFVAANERHHHELVFLEPHLEAQTAFLARGAGAVCVFVNDHVDAGVLAELSRLQVGLVALRSAGFNNVDLDAARKLGIAIARVPAYSPYAVAEHTVALILSLNRKIHRAYARVRDGNFSLAGLCGFDLHGRTVGIVGTGQIGGVFARIMAGFGCRLVAYDPEPKAECRAIGVDYVDIGELLAQADIVSLHCPLTRQTHHLIDGNAIESMKRGVMLINTGRGALVDTRAIISGLKSGQIGALGIDVYEEEEELFFEDLSAQIIQDDVFMRLLTFPNVIVTAHQAFFTEDALRAIVETTLSNVTAWATGAGELHRVD
jgi:D-lactate dehydrogenase